MVYTRNMTAKTSDSVLFVILNYKGWKDTLTCVDAVLKQTYTNFHIFLVENGSGDESFEKLKKYANHPKITFHTEPVNLGFSGGVNIGIRYAMENKYPYVALLNNDAIVTPTWLEKLVASNKKYRASVTTCLLLDSAGKLIESTGDSYSRYGLPFPRQREKPVEEALDSGYVFGGTAGASLYRTSLFEEIGLFDEKFFAYFEDTDISYRAQLAGHTAYYEKSAIAYHDHGTTSSKIPGFTVYQTFKNLPVFLWKDTPIQLLAGALVRFYACYALLYIRAVLRGQFVIATKGVLKSISLFPHALRERRRIQKTRTVTTSYLSKLFYHDLPPSNMKRRFRIFHT